MSTKVHSVGDFLKINEFALQKNDNPNDVYVIEKLPSGARGVNYVVKNTRTGQGIRGPISLFDDATAAEAKIGQNFLDQMSKLPSFVIGELAKINSKGDTVFVVIKNKGNSYDLTKLFGDNNRYYKGIEAIHLTKVNKEDLHNLI